MTSVYDPPSCPPSSHTTVYAPPPGPPPSHWYPPPLLPGSFPLLSSAQAYLLPGEGYTPLDISQRPALLDAATALFRVSRAFFAEPPTRKYQFQVRTDNAQGSEEGWSRVKGEKELLTVRRAGATCPPSIEHEARTLWRECGALMLEMMRGVEQSLGMLAGALDAVVSAECVMPQGGADRPETLLRMFRYERHPVADRDDAKGRLVSEPHRDLGLLSLVIGASPGLEVWDTAADAWIPIEAPPHAPSSGLTATLLVGETLTRLTNARYTPGRHRVFVPPADVGGSPYRYSLVFALRPHASALISTAALTTPLTGTFSHPLEGVRARALFAAIARSHWNVNTAVQLREVQRLRLMGTKDGQSENGDKESGGLREGEKDEPEENQANNELEEGTQNGQRAPASEAHSEKKKKRWSVSLFSSSRLPLENEPEAPRRWSVFQRIPRW